MQLSRFAKVTALSVAPLTLVAGGFQATALTASSPASDQSAAAFSVSALSAKSEGGLKDVTGFSANSAQGETLKAQGFGVMRAASGETAVVDTSSAREGITSAAGKGFVELSWKGYTKDARYVVTRDGKDIAQLGPGVQSFRDTDVKAGAEYDYQVVPVIPAGGHPKAKLWGMKVAVPASGSLTGLRGEAVERATTAATAKTSTLSWITFIPQKKIDAPLAGCDYGKNFQFGGDGRTKFDWKSSKYRTALHATITWSNKKVVGNKSVHASTVYVKKTGKKVATKTTTTKHMSVKKLGSGSNYVDVRMVLHAGNPFCKGLGPVKGAIDGALTMNLTKSGNWTIRSGKHRQMPNHHIYIYDGGKVSTVYTRKYANAKCLVGSVTCPEADLTGRYGKF
ncbi:hypothetical protein PV416_31435 [Streptomyces ipomoeae]|uniref:Lipoprotein n=1 Tax=Streptomyces ipomoeae 91-03 TaxID=698759 RepID=L1KS21_9ACTN|nr:hypothetical protein [Streptomyces ipomoeae]EKX63265.1 hypothetical protein STRIP9103_04970 [Streptomyces ipomoeae 91-03]MDX2698701.1 hypothetical protein [Streptomyces ipomoeae]MDX2825468.1 hypothetical protein [Streptomyces ipomoeae]MDX2842922.1 hypothetical protein [Streptomyces ipomoeae]MDX2876898.1 hypothetical protein [Streptomyces ipomoeae]